MKKEYHLERFARRINGPWSYSWFHEMSQKIELSSIGCTITLDAVYKKVIFPSP
uniref:Uncharacterized protein n=1 Tax=Candidatus Kentrum sp. SD TaxID=2126332 RepID=A0A450YVY7_9GAMM|nr:MAG: hypothetical protein BECKSD772F_GA0070984_10638 [Candidatus Kentron sp. SD]VFK45665.1 MAG: hypothetical protein BECKSD772E_GA0070983_10588 [Candidatus Kentron sp. SD]VFK79063.1 MAG: hypothetical protein BECKSD772D_GA0070982_103421 [Candidatus Kentron sp. SD]